MTATLEIAWARGGQRLPRRLVLRTALGVAGMSLLCACLPSGPVASGPSGAPASVGKSTTNFLPSFIPFAGPKPDLPGSAAGVEP
jgi:putative aldouronate transport system substrate-binding protein